MKEKLAKMVLKLYFKSFFMSLIVNLPSKDSFPKGHGVKDGEDQVGEKRYLFYINQTPKNS